MRAAYLCLVLLLALFAVRWFRPSPAAAAPEAPAPQAGDAHFLTPPEATPAASPSSQRAPPAQETVHVPEPVQETAGDVVPPARSEVPAGLDDELSVAMALVHGTPPDVQKAAAG